MKNELLKDIEGKNKDIESLNQTVQMMEEKLKDLNIEQESNGKVIQESGEEVERYKQEISMLRE